MVTILLNGVNLDSMISNYKSSTMKIGFSKNRSLSGKLFTDYLALKKRFELGFEMLTKSERDSLYNIYISSSSNGMNFTDEDGSSHTVLIVSENFDDEITYNHQGNLYYSINLILETV